MVPLTLKGTPAVTTIWSASVAKPSERAARTGSKLDEQQLRDSIQKSLDRTKDEVPEVKLVFKDVTYEQTKNPEFRAKVDKALPAAKRKQMGDWNHDFDAAKAADGQVNVSHS